MKHIFKSLLKLIFLVTPPSFMEALAWQLARLASIFARKDRQVLEQNVEKVYGLRGKTFFSSLFARQVFFHQLIVGFEGVKVALRPHLLKVDGVESLRNEMLRLEGLDQGAVLITGHLGNWELTGYLAAQATDRDFFALAKPTSNALATDLLQRLRERLGIKILWTDRRTLLKSMIGVMKAKSWLSFVMDQKPDSRRGTEVQFLGLPTVFVNGPAQMARKFNAPVIAVSCIRRGRLKYELVFKTIVENGSDVSHEELTQLMALEIERVIRLYPDQWCWNYRRWKF